MTIPIDPGNWEAGRKIYGVSYTIEAVVIHIMQGSLIGTDQHFKTPDTFVSSHDGIGKGGELHTYVEIDDKAYHAGRFNKPKWFHMKRWPWGAWKNANAYTYGIECEGFRGDRWTEAQMQTIVERTKKALDDANLPYTRDRIISHDEIAIDKEDMSEWCDEIVRRLNRPSTDPLDDNVAEAVKLLEQATALLKTS